MKEKSCFAIVDGIGIRVESEAPSIMTSGFLIAVQNQCFDEMELRKIILR